jgi:hypothetical protein
MEVNGHFRLLPLYSSLLEASRTRGTEDRVDSRANLEEVKILTSLSLPGIKSLLSIHIQ